MCNGPFHLGLKAREKVRLEEHRKAACGKNGLMICAAQRFYLRYCIFSRILYLLFDYWPSYMLLFHSGVHLDDSVWTEYAIEVVIVEHTSSTTTSFHLERDIVSYKYKHTCSGGHQSAEATTYYNNQIKESSNSLKHVQIFFLFLATFFFVKGPPLLGLYVQGISGKKMQRSACE